MVIHGSQLSGLELAEPVEGLNPGKRIDGPVQQLFPNAQRYLRSPQEATDPYVSPLLAPDLSELPPAHIMSAEFDPLRDDGELYARRLNEAGVPATFSLQRGHIHISPSFTKVMPTARAWRDEVVSVLRAANRGAPM